MLSGSDSGIRLLTLDLNTSRASSGFVACEVAVCSIQPCAEAVAAVAIV